jgi:hypothetical protein
VTISDWARSLREAYPDPNGWAQFGKLAKRDIYRFTRLWLTEGIPFAFRDKPILYELGRESLARVLGDDPKHVSMAGSARLGFSLAEKKFGQAFTSKSDLDVFLVSPAMFERLASDAQLFVDRFQAGLIELKTAGQKKYWPTNAAELPITMQSGFIDSWRVPNVGRYPAFQAVSSALTALGKTLAPAADDLWSIERLSLRTYASWDRAIAHIGGSLWRTLVALHLAE